MNKRTTVLDKLQLAEPKISSCIESSSDSFYITDSLDKSQIKTQEEENSFKVINPSQKTIYLIPIDGKQGLLGLGVTYCDAVIIDEQYFCFLEFKFKASSIAERAVRKNRKKTIGQLENTINYFDELLARDYDGLALEAYVSTLPIYPRANTAWQDLAVAFLEKNKICLYEKSEKEF